MASSEAAKRRVAQSYDAQADDYSAWVLDRPLNQGLFDEFAALLSAELAGRPDAQVLDVASASGEPAATLARALPAAAVHATDLSPAFVELGRQRARRLGLLNLHCQVADAEALEALFSAATCDAVTCCMGLMFMDLDKVLPQLARVLKPGGLLVAAAWQAAERNPFWCSLVPAIARDIDPDLPGWSEADIAPYTATRFADPAELLAGLAAAGLREAACRPLPVTYTMTADAWWPSLLRIPDLPVKAALQRAQARPGADPAAVEQAERQAAERRLRERGWLLPDGSVRAPDQGAWLVTARKPV